MYLLLRYGILLSILFLGWNPGVAAGPLPLRLPTAPPPAPAPSGAVRDTVPARYAGIDSVRVAEIVLLGHKRTRGSTILRELPIKRGDRIATQELETAIELGYNNLMNTGLFARMEVRDSLVDRDAGEIWLILDINETWYLYPVPVFELADRNFNVWWNEQNRDLDRINVGGKLTYYNFTGRRDRLKVGVQTGYTQEYEASYSLPYLNPAGSIGASVSYRFQRRREQNYATRNNEQLFYQDRDAFVYRHSTADVSVNYRPGYYMNHSLSLGYRNTTIADTIARVLNPEFFGGGRNAQQFLRATYTFTNDRRDVRNYPWKGTYLQLQVEKDGLGIWNERSGMTLGATYRKFIPWGEKYSVNFGAAGKYSLIRSQQPFLENRAIGFGSNGVVGYQFYVVDGLDMVIWRAGIRREFFDLDLDLGKWVFIDAFRYIPVRLLLAAQFNQGFANSPFADESNALNNNLLTGYSVGLDVVLFYDMVGSVQYNHNHLGEGGFFLALNLNF